MGTLFIMVYAAYCVGTIVAYVSRRHSTNAWSSIGIMGKVYCYWWRAATSWTFRTIAVSFSHNVFHAATPWPWSPSSRLAGLYWNMGYSKNSTIFTTCGKLR